MSLDATTPCAFTDAVLAVLLDGDRNPQPGPHDSPEVLDLHSLAEHRDECPECQRALGEARQVDALLAASTDIAMDDPSADALFAAVRESLGESQPVSVPPSRSGLRILLPLAAVLVLGFGIGWWVFAPEASSAPLPQIAGGAAPSVDLETPADETSVDGRLRVPEHARSRRIAAVSPAGPDAEQSVDLLPRLIPLLDGLAAVRPVGPAGLLALETAGRNLVDHSVGQLLNQGSAPRSALVEALRSWPDGAALERLRAELHDRPTQRRALVQAQRRTARFEASLPILLRIGDSAADRALRQAVGREFPRATTVALQLAQLERRSGRVELLLELWRRTDRSESDREELALLDLWFTEQPEECSDQLLDAFSATRRASERKLCLLALGLRADPATAGFLRDLLNSSRQEERHLAAWALGRLPHTAPGAHRLQLRRLRRSVEPLVVAAWITRGDPRAEPWLQRAQFSAEERARTFGQRLDPDTFLALARRLRSAHP